MMKTKYFKDFFLIFILCLSVFVLILTILFLPRRISFINLLELKDNFLSIKGSDWIQGISITLQPVVIIFFAFIMISVIALWIASTKNQQIKAKKIFQRSLEINSVLIILSILIWYWNKNWESIWYLHSALASMVSVLISSFALRQIIKKEKIKKSSYKQNKKTSKMIAI